MTKVYIYKLTVDLGGAPCVSEGNISHGVARTPYLERKVEGRPR